MIHWSIDPEIFSVGPFSIRWYGLLFALSFIIGYQIMIWVYKLEKRPEKDLNDLVWYMILGTVIGARLGHCLLYNADFYLANPIEILKVWRGGLASHGAAIGILLALYFFVRSKKIYSYLWIVDRVVVSVALAGAFIRLGNLFNSEIYGKVSSVPWAFIFTSVDDLPRHPTQLYESLAYFISFLVLFFYYKKNYKEMKEGILLGLFLIFIFGFRIIVEFFKENQEAFESSLPLNMGQLLSIPFVILGIYLIVRKSDSKTISKEEVSK